MLVESSLSDSRIIKLLRQCSIVTETSKRATMEHNKLASGVAIETVTLKPPASTSTSLNAIPLTMRESKLKELCDSFRGKYLDKTSEHLQMERKLIMSNARFESITVDLSSLKAKLRKLESELQVLKDENSTLKTENKELTMSLEKVRGTPVDKAPGPYEYSDLDSSERINGMKLELMGSK